MKILLKIQAGYRVLFRPGAITTTEDANDDIIDE